VLYVRIPHMNDVTASQYKTVY